MTVSSTPVTVLIVEDELITADDIRFCLQDMGYRAPLIVNNGPDAILKAGEIHPDIVLMDITLHGEMSGIEAAARIKNDLGIPVIFLTAHSDESVINKALESEPFGYIIKPFESRHLRISIEMARYKHTLDQKLRTSEELHRALTENTSDIIFSTDMGGLITFVSPQVNKYGFLFEELIGKSLRTLIHPADIDPVEVNKARELEKGAQFVSQYRILDKWGGIFWFEEKSSLRLDLLGKPVGIYGILHDVTERKRVEDAIEIANKKLNLMNQITRHDILNTITGLLGCVDMAKATTSPEEREQLLNDIRDLTRIIQRHITLTREYQEVGIHLPQWQNVNDLLSKVLQNFQKSGILFSIECQDIEIYADPLLEKVFYNLVDNAVRYGAHVTTLKFYYVISDDGLALICEDDGIGIPESTKEKIFERGVGQNTGMGLFLTREILTITGIKIRENGMPGRGARFEIMTPNGTWRFVRNIER
ncbi:MAG: PAS domain S-box protein [Methanoregula sp.]|nr:PAS domain S-box protein [Methanoregula sp.]